MDLHGCVTMEEMLSEALLNNVPVFKPEIFKHGSHYRSKETAGHMGHINGLLPPQQHCSGGVTMSQSCAAPPMLYHSPTRPHQLSLPAPPHRQEPPHLGVNSNDWVNLMTSVNLPHLDEPESRFQYMLCASTSPAVKVDEESLTYLNQGQSYELKLKRLSDHSDEHFLKTRVRVIFHERRLQYMEKEQMEHWKTVRPGERILDLDVPISCGLSALNFESHNLNCFEFTWEMEAAVYIKINCISTEFTAKKHGGEKGVPFRIQVETYSSGSNGKEQLTHCASCQVKVFKPKGADRKHKTDREKIEKLSDIDRDRYQHSFDYTILTEIPLDQVLQYLEQLKKQQESDRLLLSGHFIKEENRLAITDGSSCLYRADCGQTLADSSSRSSENDCRSPRSNAVTPGITRKCFEETLNSPVAIEPASLLPVDHLSIHATSQQVSQWLRLNRFSNFVLTFQNFSGADILRLSREDLILLCGSSDGIRLNNALHVKHVRPCLTLHVVLEPLQMSSHYDPCSTMRGSSINISTSSSGCWSPTSSNSPSSILSSLQSNGHPDPDQTTLSPLSPPSRCTSSVPDIMRFQKFQTFNKRCSASDNDVDKDRPAAKKRCLKSDEVYRDQVFHAIHLEFLTKDHLVQRLANLFELQTKQISEMCLQTSSGIIIYVSDSVVQNLNDLSRFVAVAKEDDKHTGLFRILLKLLEFS